MRMIDADVLKDKAETSRETTYDFQSLIDAAPTIAAIPAEWLRNVRNDERLTLDDVETIDLLLTWWQKEQEERK